MHWLHAILSAHREIAFFLVLGIGYLLGNLALGSFKLGAVTGTLLAGVIVGQLGITLPNEVKECFFLLFLFSIGYRTGPQFFRGLRTDGLAHAALAALVATTGILASYVVARLFGYDTGTAAGLFAGSMTESAAIGTAMDAIGRFEIAETARTALANNIPVAFAVTYLVGMTVAAWFLSQLAPRLMGIDLAEECRKLEQQMQGPASAPLPARREFELRAYAVDLGSKWIDRALLDLESSTGAKRMFVERLRRGGQVLEVSDHMLLGAGDVIAVSGRRQTLVEVLDAPGGGLREVDDKDLLDLAADVVDVVVTNTAVDARALADLAREEVARGVFVRRLTRAGLTVGILPDTTVQRGDVLTLVGSAANTARAIEYLGVADRWTDATNMVVVAAGIVVGGLIGLPALRVAAVAIGLSLPVGVLLGGLVCGWLRVVQPRRFGHIPAATLWVFESLGLTGFVAVVGLGAGPAFVQGLRTTGLSLLLAGALTITTALLVGVVLGRWVFKMHPGTLLGVCAGACTATPALAAIQETARSAVPSAGYGVAYAVGNVVLAVGGTVIVALLGA